MLVKTFYKSHLSGLPELWPHNLPQVLFLSCLLAMGVSGCSTLGGQDSSLPESQVQPQTDVDAGTTDQAVGLDGTDTTVEVIPQQVVTQFASAVAAMKGGQLDRAQSEFSKMTQEYPEFSGPYLNLGLIALSAKDTETARGYLQKAVELNAGNAEAYVALGLIERQAGHFPEAEQFYLKAIASDEQNASAHLNLGIVYDLYMGKLEQALEHYKVYQSLQSEPVEQVNFWIVDIESRL